MNGKKADRPKILVHLVATKVDEQKYRELRKLLDRDSNLDMSQLLRAILYNRPVLIRTRDETVDDLMEELARLRGEIKAIGVNINQITRQFNTYPEPQRKVYYAKLAFQEYLAIGARVDRLLELISQNAKKWLQK